MTNPYLTRLEALDDAGFMVAPASQRLVLLTGQSSFLSSRLRPEQQSFLHHIAPPGTQITLSGFPWHRDFDGEDSTATLAAASWRNARQWWWAGRNARFTGALARALALIQARTEHRLLVVTGSCGIHLLSAALEQITPSGPALRVFALGPAGRLPPPAHLNGFTVAQGQADSWSHMLWSGPVHHRPACGHLNYYQDEETRALAKAFLAQGSPA